MSIIRHKSLTNILSGYRASLYTELQKNIKRNITTLVCQMHDSMKITAICLISTCDKNSRMLCIKCMLADDHKDHRLKFLLVEEILQKPLELDKLVKFFQDFKNNLIIDEDGQIEWLYNAIIKGRNLKNYPLSCTYQIDDVISQIHSEFNQLLSVSNFCSIKSNDKGKLDQFKSEINKIISKTNLEIQSTFQDIFLENSEEQKSTLSFSVINEEEIVKPKMPCLKFVELKSQNKKWSLFKKETIFSQGGKLITMQNQNLIYSSIAFNNDLIEVRFRIKSAIIGCLHMGIVENSLLQIASNLESVGIWGCLFHDCSLKSKMKQESEVIGVPEESVVGILLDFTNDKVILRQWTRERVVELYSKSGCLMKQKYNFFLQCADQQKLELLN